MAKQQKLSKDIPPELRRQLLKIRRISSDFRRYCANNLKIKLESGEIIPFKLNPIQEIILENVLDDLANKRPVRYIILKARKEGVSTLVEALILWWTATHQNVRSKIVAHDKDTAMELYEMFRRFYDNANPLFKPSVKYNTRSDLTFDNEQGTGLKSMIDVSSAKETGTGRGMTITCLHGCIHKDSLVVMVDGTTKPIKDIKVGDIVLTGSGDVAPVSFKTMTGIKPTFTINTWMSNEPIHATKDHKILTIDGYKTVSELTSKDYIAKPKYKNSYMEKNELTFTYHSPKRKQGGGTSIERVDIVKLNYDFGYLLGYYLAEGSITKNISRITFTHHTDEHFVDKIMPFFKNKPSVKTIGNKTQTTFNDRYMCYMINVLCDRTVNKRLPSIPTCMDNTVFMWEVGNIDFRKGIFEGYLDGDGSKTDPVRVRATSVSENIARGINRIGDEIGKHGSLQYYRERNRYGVENKPVWVNSFCNGNNKPHIKKYKIIDGQVFVRVKSIEEYEIAETYDLEIQHEDHNFETTIGVVSNSEVASWSDGSELMAGLMQAVPKIPNTMIFLESTANGIGDFFHKTWQAAKAGNSVFKPLFFSWSDRPDYSAPIPRNFKLTEEEKEIKKKFDLNDNQIAWRRETMKEFANDPRKFYQEYPLTDIEAFLSSGSSRFDIASLVKMEERCKPAKTYDLIEDTAKKKIDFNTPFSFDRAYKPIEVENAPLKIWEQPRPDAEYVIGADVAEGIGEDFSVATIIKKETMETVARWRGDAEPAEFGEILDTLGRYYNTALIGCEINNHGLTTVQRLRDMNYPNLYRREKGLDERFERHTSKLGWQTSTRTKPLMINALSEAITLGKIKDYDITFVRECMEYVVDDRGRTNAQTGSHDDTVVATAIALQMYDWVDEVVERINIPSKIPKKYAEIKRKHRELSRKSR